MVMSLGVLQRVISEEYPRYFLSGFCKPYEQYTIHLTETQQYQCKLCGILELLEVLQLQYNPEEDDQPTNYTDE